MAKNQDVIGKLKNPFSEAYWFARILVDSEYSGIASNHHSEMLQISTIIDNMLEKIDGEEEFEAAKQSLFNLIRRACIKKRGTKKEQLVENFMADIDEMLESKKDLFIFNFALKNIVLLGNRLIKEIPSNDREFSEIAIETYLGRMKEKGLKDAIRLWDRLGSRGCMEAERIEVVQGFKILRNIISEKFKNSEMTVDDADWVLTAFVQELERRLSRGVRPGRAGRSLEDVTGVILTHFGIKHRGAPEHLKTRLEFDNVVKCRDGKLIGISCKRTLRERYKQSTTGSDRELDRFGVKRIWYVITFTKDLSDAKIKAVGETRGAFYLPDDDSVYLSAKAKKELKNYVFPMSNFIRDLKKEIGLFD